MRLLVRLLSLGCLVVAMAACASTIPKRVEPANEANSSPSTRQILVTFPDERSQRIPIGDPVNPYRRRGDYQNSTWSGRVAGQLAEQYGLKQIAQWPITTLGVHCVVYEIPADQSVENVLRLLEQDERVESVQTMKRFRVMAEAYSDPYFKLQASLLSMHIESAQQISTGRNIKIAVIDTGVDATHPDLRGQVSHAENFVANSPETSDDIHGTAVAGIIAALANNGRGIVGIAPDSKLIALKACWQNEPERPEAVCDTLTLALALNTAIILKPQVINLSLTGPKDLLLERLIEKALDNGITVVASEPATPDPSNDFPASMKRVIAVRTSQREGVANGPNKPFVAAPGSEILTTLPHDTYNFMSGSSFAAAHVSGLVALLLQLNPHLMAQQIEAILHKATTHLASTKALETIDAYAAIANLRGLTPSVPTPEVQHTLALPSNF